MLSKIKLQLFAAVAMLGAFFAPLAHAALDAAVTTEISNAKADILALGALVFGIVIAIAVYKWFRRAV